MLGNTTDFQRTNLDQVVCPSLAGPRRHGLQPGVRAGAIKTGQQLVFAWGQLLRQGLLVHIGYDRVLRPEPGWIASAERRMVILGHLLAGW